MTETRRYVSPKREADAAATRARILDAFRDQLVLGMETLSPSGAAEQAGCSVRTVHGHFPTSESRIAALADHLEAELYTEPAVMPETPDQLPDHYRRIHRVALGSPLAAALLGQPSAVWREIRAARRHERLDAVRRVVRAVGAPAAATEPALAMLLALAGGEVAISMREHTDLEDDDIPDAIASTVELIIADLTQRAGESC